MECFTSILGMGKTLFGLAVPWVRYHNNLDTNMETLKRKTEKLNGRNNDVNEEVNYAEQRSRKRRRDEVKLWQEDVRRITDDVQTLERRELEVRGWKNAFKRMVLGKRVVEMIKEVEKLHENGKFSNGLLIDYTIGWDSRCFRDEGNYTEFIQAYLMRLLSGAGRAEREKPAAPAGVGASRMARARGRSGSRRGRGAEWPALPTMMTCRGQGGETYQIPIAPPPADHELVGVYGSAPASIEYTRQSLELTASVMEMLQRSLDLLTIYGISAPFQILATGGAPAGLSVLAQGGGGVRRGMTFHNRGRHRRTHAESSSRGPSSDGSDEEAASSQGEAGDSSDSDYGAGSGDPGPSSRKWTRTDSRT